MRFGSPATVVIVDLMSANFREIWSSVHKTSVQRQKYTLIQERQRAALAVQTIK